MAGWSLRARLARRILLATGVVWCLVLVAGLAVMGHEMGEIADAALEEQAHRIAQLTGGPDAPPAAEDASGVHTRVIRPGAEPPPAPWPPLAADGRQSVGGWTVVRATGPTGVVVEVGESGVGRGKDFWEAAGAWLLLTVPLLGLLLVVVVVTVRSALAPVRVFADMMERRRASDLSPVPETGLPDELLPIPRTFSRYLGRIDALLASERDFSANAAHELRTPLAVAAAQAQLIAQGRAGPQAAEAIVGAVTRLGSIVERLLELARAEAVAGGMSDRVDVVRVMRLLIAEAPEGKIRFDDGDIDRMEVGGDADSVGLLLGNLLRNALQHGTGEVRVRLGPGPRVEISNPARANAAFVEGRFATGPRSHGSGLGLAIARATATRFGWGLDLAVADGRATAHVDFAGPPDERPAPG